MMAATENKFLSSRALLLVITVFAVAIASVFVGFKILGKDDSLSSSSATTLPDNELTSTTGRTSDSAGDKKTATTLPTSDSETASSQESTSSAKTPENPTSTSETEPKPVTPQPDNGKPYMHITFDDGPHELTLYVLNMLAKHDVQATFFMLGNRIEERPAMAKQVQNAGHAIGNHSYKHDGWKTIGVNAAKADASKTQGVIQGALDITPSCARAPFGDDSPEVVAMLDGLGMDHWEWDLDPKEWESGRDGRLKNLLDNPSSVPKLTNTDGHILLLHDSHPSLKSAIDTLDAWIEANKDNYQFTAIPGCLDYQ